VQRRVSVNDIHDDGSMVARVFSAPTDWEPPEDWFQVASVTVPNVDPKQVLGLGMLRDAGGLIEMGGEVGP
jgi:hypothetical protein